MLCVREMHVVDFLIDPFFGGATVLGGEGGFELTYSAGEDLVDSLCLRGRKVSCISHATSIGRKLASLIPLAPLEMLARPSVVVDAFPLAFDIMTPRVSKRRIISSLLASALLRFDISTIISLSVRMRPPAELPAIFLISSSGLMGGVEGASRFMARVRAGMLEVAASGRGGKGEWGGVLGVELS